MTLEEAQSISKSGVAVLGNPIMEDVVWPKGSPHPYRWNGKGYVAQAEGRWADRLEWEPLDDPSPNVPTT